MLLKSIDIRYDYLVFITYSVCSAALSIKVAQVHDLIALYIYMSAMDVEDLLNG